MLTNLGLMILVALTARCSGTFEPIKLVSSINKFLMVIHSINVIISLIQLTC